MKKLIIAITLSFVFIFNIQAEDLDVQGIGNQVRQDLRAHAVLGIKILLRNAATFKVKDYYTGKEASLLEFMAPFMSPPIEGIVEEDSGIHNFCDFDGSCRLQIYFELEEPYQDEGGMLLLKYNIDFESESLKDEYSLYIM